MYLILLIFKKKKKINSYFLCTRSGTNKRVFSQVVQFFIHLMSRQLFYVVPSVQSFRKINIYNL
jgi:hypothetical protein